MKKNNLFLLATFLFMFSSVISAQVKISTYLPWSQRIADSFIERHPATIIDDSTFNNKWTYDQGVVLEGLHQIWKTTGRQKYYDYIKTNIDQFITDSGKIHKYKYSEFNLDLITPGRQLLLLYSRTNNKKYKIAADTLRKQIANQPRTPSGGFWHKKIYPNQMWLDGLYMCEPFYTEYSQMFGEKKNFNDIVKQFILIAKHTYDSKTGLYYHAWDESKQQKWADSVSGKSPCIWGRAMGWYAMALVDVLDYLPNNHPQKKELIKIIKNLCQSLLKYRDKETNVWYQIVDQGERKGNYLESSSSCMFTYTFAKAANKGYVQKEFLKYAKESFDGIIKTFVDVDDNGFINLNKTVHGVGLGGVPYRDGSFEYYTSVALRSNDLRALGPFMLSALELEKARIIKPALEDLAVGKNKVVGLDYYFNHELKKNSNDVEHQYHYTWQDKENSGYSELGSLIENLGASCCSIKESPTDDKLKNVSMYIIVDPDTPKETEKPNYIDAAAIAEITKWVKQGGVLVLMANDKGNCEFENLNKLSKEFGIIFNEDSRNHVDGRNFDMGKFDQFPKHPIFSGVKKIYLKEISTFTLTPPAKSILTESNNVVMACANYGKGFVYAVGDPWLYNEYIDSRKLPVDFENYKAGINLFKWLLTKASEVKKK